MKCPRDANHKLNIKLEDPASCHYARLECPICDQWLKWLSEDETNELLANDGETEEPLSNMYWLQTCMGPKAIEAIRELIREELQKALMGMLTPHEGDKL